MPRNFDRRIEVLAPIRKNEHKKRLLHLLDTYWESDLTTRELQPDGRYLLRKPGANATPKRAQLLMMQEAQAQHERLEQNWNPRSQKSGLAVLRKKKAP